MPEKSRLFWFADDSFQQFTLDWQRTLQNQTEHSVSILVIPDSSSKGSLTGGSTECIFFQDQKLRGQIKVCFYIIYWINNTIHVVSTQS